MPVYEFECPKCEKQYEAYVAKIGEKAPCECGGTPEQIWGITKRQAAATGYPYTTRNIRPDGKPVVVESASHEASLCKRYGVTKRDDAAFLFKRYEGYDLRNKKQKYVEGNGVGMKGCWI